MFQHVLTDSFCRAVPEWLDCNGFLAIAFIFQTAAMRTGHKGNQAVMRPVHNLSHPPTAPAVGPRPPRPLARPVPTAPPVPSGIPSSLQREQSRSPFAWACSIVA